MGPASSHAPLAGQVALVTGASSGIGFGISVALAAAGAAVGVNYHRDERKAAETLVARIAKKKLL